MEHLLSLGRFYGIDSLIDFLIVIVSVLIFYQAREIYKIVREKKFQYFSLSFLFIGISYLFKIIVNFTFIYSFALRNSTFISCLSCLIRELETMQWVNLVSTLLFEVFILGGFLILFLVFTRKVEEKNNFVFFYFSAVIILFSVYFGFIFNLTLSLILFFLLISFYQNYERIKSKDSLMIFISFLVIFISNALGIFFKANTSVYLVEEILLLIGFVILFFTHSRFRLKNEKKNKT